MLLAFQLSPFAQPESRDLLKPRYSKNQSLSCNARLRVEAGEPTNKKTIMASTSGASWAQTRQQARQLESQVRADSSD